MQEVAKIPKSITRGYYHTGKDLTSIRWDYNPWEISSTYIDIKTDAEGKIERIYNELIKNKYFLQSTGWSIVENYSTEFKFHLSEELMAEWKADEKRLSDDINKFYAGTNYWGD